MVLRIAKGEREEGQRKGTGIGAKGAERWRAAAQDQEPGGGEDVECSQKDC